MVQPLVQHCANERKRFAHWCLTFSHRQHPNWKSDRNLYPSATAIRYFPVAGLYLYWIVGHFSDRHDLALFQRRAKRAAHASSISDNANVVVVPNFLSFSATNYQVMKGVIDNLGDEVAL